MFDAGVVPRDPVLIGIGVVVFRGHVVTENEIRERLEAVREAAGHVDGQGGLLSNVGREHLAARAVEYDDTGHSRQAGEEVILVSFVVMKAPNYALTGKRDVRLDSTLGEPA